MGFTLVNYASSGAIYIGCVFICTLGASVNGKPRVSKTLTVGSTPTVPVILMKGGNCITNQLIFLSNKLMSPHVQRTLRLPIHFVSFAHMPGQLYTVYGNTDMFNYVSRRSQRKVVYGAIFLLENYDFHIRTLDSYGLCSLSALGRNHSLDTLHRIDVEVTPIKFNTLDELARLLYKEMKPIQTQTYVGNLTNPKINLRTKRHTYHVHSNIDKQSFKQLYREVSHA